jgi:acyl-CoA synthetase (AMP-forming)/AMP-acid ligase II
MSGEAAIRCGQTERTYPELQARVAKIAGGLRAVGVRPGDKVALVLRNSVEFLEASAAVTLCGGNPVPVNWHWQDDELRYLLTDSGSRAVFAHTEFVPAVTEVLRARYDLSSLRYVVHSAVPCPPQVKQQIIDWFRPIVIEYYGGSETGLVVWCDSAEWLAHPGTVGRPTGERMFGSSTPTVLPFPSARWAWSTSSLRTTGPISPTGEMTTSAGRWNSTAT